MLNGLDLFSGIGGISIALSEWVNTVAYCEQDRYAQAVLLSRMAEGKLHNAPLWDDVRSLNSTVLDGVPVDIIFGGFPCQDISVAGLGVGLAGQRSGLFFEIIRLVKEVEPSFIFLENVPAIRTRGLREVISAFTEIGYDCRWTCLSAASVGAPHKRERWFLLAHANGELIRNADKPERATKTVTRNDGSKESLANANSERLEGYGHKRVTDKGSRQERQSGSGFSGGKDNGGFWATESDVCRVVNGLPNRVDRIKCLGNSVVPQQVREAFKILGGIT